MSRVFTTGSAAGLGQMAARLLVAGGHKAVVHARDESRAQEAFAVARLWPGVLSNALEPGWVATKMGGPCRGTT